MSVNQYINGKLNLIAGGYGSGGGGECGCEENTFTGTKEEVQAAIAAGEIKDDFIIFVTDDFEEMSDNKIEYVTQEEYDALPESKLTDNVEYRITDKGIDSVSASNVKYDGSASGLSAMNVQGAVDELKEELNNSVDELQGDISTLNNSLGLLKEPEYLTVLSEVDKTFTVPSEYSYILLVPSATWSQPYFCKTDLVHRSWNVFQRYYFPAYSNCYITYECKYGTVKISAIDGADSIPSAWNPCVLIYGIK